VLAPRLPLAVPVPVRVGEPGLGYPWRWAIVRWIEGESLLSTTEPVDQIGLGCRARPVPRRHPRGGTDDAPRNAFRACPSSIGSTGFADHLRSLPDDVDRAAVEARGPRRWTRSRGRAGGVDPRRPAPRQPRRAARPAGGGGRLRRPHRRRPGDRPSRWRGCASPRGRGLAGAVVSGSDAATWGRARGWALAHAVACWATVPTTPRWPRWPPHPRRPRRRSALLRPRGSGTWSRGVPARSMRPSGWWRSDLRRRRAPGRDRARASHEARALVVEEGLAQAGFVVHHERPCWATGSPIGRPWRRGPRHRARTTR